MKPFFRFFLGSALAVLASVEIQAAPVMIPAGVSAAAASAAPGDTITISVSATNGGAATPADDLGAGGTVTGTVVFTHRVTGATISTGSVSFSTTAIVAGAGGAGTFTRTFTIPTITSQAGSYNATVTLTGASSGTASGSFTSTNVLAVTGTPDLAITGLTYPSGTAYRGGDVIPMTLSYTNRTSSNGSNNVPYVSSTNGNASFFRIEVILSSNPTFGDADDFLLTAHSVSASSSAPLNANSIPTTLNWNQILPGNFAGSYYVMARIDTLSGVTETVENDLSDNGNNIYYSPDFNAARISLLPTNFPTVYWASTSGNAYSDNPSITSDGRYTAFVSDATNLVVGDTNGARDVFIYDNQTATIRRLSVAQQGAQANAASNQPAISAVSPNGTYVAFASDATNLALDDTNGFSDIYVVNAFSGGITRVSLSTGGGQADGANFKPAISATGRFVVWESSATNLVPGGTAVGVTHIYLRDRDVSNSGTYDIAGNVSTVLVSQATGTSTPGNANSIQASISADGRYVAFASDATNLGGTVGGGFRNVYVRDTVSSVTTLASFGTGGTASNGSSRAPSVNRNAGVTTGISADGRHVAFGSEASNLIAAGTDTNSVSDIFVFDRVASSITRVSVSSSGAQAVDPSLTPAQQVGSINPSISATGRYVTFASLANNLTAGDSLGQSSATDSNNAMDVFVMDRDVSGSGVFDTAANIATTMVSKNRFGYQTVGLIGTPSTAASDIYPVISADGRWVAFPSDAENTAGLVHGATNRTSPDLNTFRDVFLHDRRINALPSATTPPTVAVTSPVTGTSYPVNSAITLIGSANAPAGTIASVQFFVNGTSLGVDSIFPYNAIWTPTATGTFALSALVTDSFGNQAASANVNITIAPVSPTAPIVSITSPVSGASLFANGPTTISASATDPDGTIASVQFFANGVSIGTDTTFPYSIQFTPVATGNYTLTAVATDNGGNQTTTSGVGNALVTVTNLTAPTISITSPTPVSINAATTISATASSAGSIASVQFRANGTTLGTLTTAPFTFSWTPTAAGSYSLSAIATDNLGSQTTSAAITVDVSSGASPVFFPLAPTVAAAVSVNTPQIISAAVTDADGTVASVRFSVNGTALGTVTTFPYTITWTPTSSGIYTVLAVATDNLGNQTTSSAATVTVSSGTAPAVSITSPSNLATFSNGGTSTITASATPNTGTIANVRFFVNGVLIGTDTTFPYSATFTPVSNGVLTLTAIATDSVGNQTTSAAVTVNVTSGTPPTVSIQSPASGAAVGVGLTQTIVANATAANSTIASVQFFANGVPLGTDTTFPYNQTWTPTAVGVYNLTALATDSVGNQTTSVATAITVAPVSPNPPVVAIAAPAAGASLQVGAATLVTANASDADGSITNVEFFANGILLGVDAIAPYNVTFTPTVTGPYVLTARATDNGGNITTSAAVSVTVTANAAPVVRVTAPTDQGSVGVGSTNTITATATANNGTIVSVQFFVNGVSLSTDTTFPFAATWTPQTTGSFTLTARATDNFGTATDSGAVTVNVTGGTAPTVSIASPANSATVGVGLAQTIVANATAANGTIASVQFFANGVSLGTDTTFPYNQTWTPTAVGVYSLTALATDSVGNQTTSAAVSVTVTANAAPVVRVTAPTDQSSVGVGSTNTITATATANNGTIVSVQFFVNGVSLSTDTTFPFAATWTPQTTGSFTLTSRATDNFGTVMDSGAVTVNVTGGTAPTVSITSPANSATVGVGLAQTIVANATAANGTIASVQFFANGVSLGTDTTFPYNQAWTPAALGTYSLTAVATDAIGNQTTSAATLIVVAPVSPSAPVVAITAPTAGSSLPIGVATLFAANATDSDGSITSVEFFANGVSLGLDLTFPYSVNFTPTVTGAYVLTARATDNGGNVTTSAAITVVISGGTAPSVAISSPSSGVALGVNLLQSITATATSPGSFVRDVQFFLNGQPLSLDATFPYSAEWTPSAIGTYTLTARATDSLGNATDSAPVVVAVTSSASPIVVVTNPSNGSSFTVGAGLNLAADASDPDGTVTAVQFLVNGVPQGAADTASPYTATWSPVSSGVYTITARATDNTGNTTTSAPVTVTIGVNAAPTVALTSPAAGSYSLGNLVLVSAAAADADGSVASVQFFANGLSIGTATAAPFNTSWRPALAGTFRLTAVATDNVGNVTTSSAVNVTITSTAAPVVLVSNPIVGRSYGVGTLIPFAATTSGGNGPIAQVQFFVNGTSIGVDTDSPYSVNFTPNAPGAFNFLAIATDSAGISSSSSASVSITVTGNAPPSVVLTSPPNGTSVNGGTVVNLTAIATDADGTVATVRFLANDNQVGAVSSSTPYGSTWTPSAAGIYRITAQATDNSGNVTNSSPIDVVVVANLPPTISMTAPSTGSIVRVGSGATLAATPSDSDGTITSVQFFANGLSVGVDTTSPYSTQWTPGAEGVYRITAVALDNSGAATTSSVVTVLAIGATSGGSDMVYSGTYSGIGDTGRFAAISVRGKSAAFIGFSSTVPNRVYFYDNLPVDASGGFYLADSLGRAVISGAVNDTGASGSLEAGRVTFIGPVTFPSTTGAVAAGFYTGNLTGRSGSVVDAIVGPDGSIMLYVADGTAFRDAGAGAVNSLGAFAVTTASGNRLVGRADPVTGFLSGSLSGGPGGTFTAAVSSGISFSDGFLKNLSTRGPVGTGNDILVAGFAVSGTAPKRVMIRAVGPSLAAFGVPGTLADTRLELFRGNTVIGTNDNWGGSDDLVAAAAAVGAFPLARTSLDSVILTTLLPGLYTAQVRGVGSLTGAALVELYDVDSPEAFSTQKLVNVATRGVLTALQDTIIAGFMVSGTTAKKVLVRAVGPTLGGPPFNLPGTLANPMLRLIRSDGLVVRENDNWEVGNDSGLINDASVKVGAFALTPGSRDSVLLLNLPPGTYSAVVTGAAPGTGMVLVEVYEVP